MSMSKERNPAVRSSAATRADDYEARQNLRWRCALSLVLATLVVIAEMAVLRPSAEAPDRPRAKPNPIDAPAFVLPPRPPSDLLVGGKICVG